MNRRLRSHCPPLRACVLAAPRWLAVLSALPLFPAPSNAPAGLVCAAGFAAGRVWDEVAEPEE